MDLASENTRVAEELSDKRLICEARFELSDVDRFKRYLFPLGRRAWEYPALTSLVTVGCGIYCYDAGNFWNAFENLKNLPTVVGGERSLRNS